MTHMSGLGKIPVAWISQKGPALQCDPDPGWSRKCVGSLPTLVPTLLLFLKVLHPTRFQLPLDWSTSGVCSKAVSLLVLYKWPSSSLSSTVRLFADDTMLYLTVQNNKDAERTLATWPGHALSVGGNLVNGVSSGQVRSYLSYKKEKSDLLSLSHTWSLVTILNMWIMLSTSTL